MLWFVMVLIVFTAGFIQGITGFGSAMIAVSLLSLVLDIKLVIPLVAQLSMVTVIILTYQLRAHFKFKHIKPLIVGSIAGIPLGVLFLKSVDGQMVRAVLGILLVTYGLWQLIRPDYTFRLSRGMHYFLGFLAGILGGAFNTNGPPAIIYATSQPWNHHEMKVTLTSYFMVSGVLVISFHGVAGLITVHVLKHFATLAPVLMLGTLTGSHIYDRLSPDKFRTLVLISLIVLGVGLLVKSSLFF